MLVLSRKPGESVCVGDDIEIKIVKSRSNVVRIGVTAPKDIIIDRKEIRQRLDYKRVKNAVYKSMYGGN